MDKIATLTPDQRSQLFQETASQRGMSAAVVEKDFWVCWVLKQIFSDAQLRPHLVFKGGTSLSKVFGLIERFSEDIDLILDWRLLGYGPGQEDPYQDQPSNTQQDCFNAEFNVRAASAVKQKALADLQLLKDVVAFKRRFYRCPWANYESAQPGTFRLIPAQARLEELEKDYRQMKVMIFGAVPKFDQVINTLKTLEDEINQLTSTRPQPG
jgi:hypothetical protein